ncbi:MAG: T9SS type A sorting domain-containing protein [Bacteroidota bacterium]
MKIWYGILVAIFLLVVKNTNAQNFQWAARAGSYAFDLGYGIGTDNAGNIYIAGKYELNANFGGTIVGCAGNHDIYIAKYNPLGVFQWVRTAGGPIGDYAHSLAVDGEGNSYLAGEFEKTAMFGSVALTSRGGNDIFVAKYNTNGDFQWTKSIGGGGGSDRGLGISESNGNVYVTGDFQGTGYFPGNILPSTGGLDIFVAKYNSAGDFQWIKKAGGTGNDEGYAVSCDQTGNAYVTGYFSGTANFSGTSIASQGANDIFIAKYNPAGAVLWVKRAGGTASDYGMGIKVDNYNNVFLTGGFRLTSTFGSISLKAIGGDADIFIARYTASGDCVWANKAGGNINDYGRAIALDASSNCYITGNFGLSAAFGTTTITGVDSAEIYFASYDASGNFRWVLQAGGMVDVSDPDRFIEMGLSIATDLSGNVVASGAYRSSSAFGGATLNPWGNHTDVYITKIGAAFIPPVDPPPVALCSGSGTITRDLWTNVTGTSIASIPFNTSPTSTGQLSIFESPSNVADYYGSRIRGYICPPVSGNYTFWIASDNNSELWLSTNDQAANKIKIASVPGYTSSRLWTKYPEQQSVPVNLTAGVKYYIEALHRESTLGDNLAVGWQLPDGLLERPIPGIRLFPFSVSKNMSLDQPPDLKSAESAISRITSSKTVTFCSGSSVILKTIEDPMYAYSWKKNGVMIKGANEFTYKANSSGNYSVRIMAGKDSVTTETIIVSESENIEVSVAPSDPIFCQDTSIVLKTNTGDEYVYQWRRNGITIPGANQKYYKTDKSGDYQVKIIQGACFDWSGITNVSLQECLKSDSTLKNNVTNSNDINSFGAKDDSLLIRIFPNPNSGLFTLEINMVHKIEKAQEAKVEVINALGQVVYHRSTSFNKGYLNEHIELENSIQAGIYFLQVTIGDKVEKTRMMLSK